MSDRQKSFLLQKMPNGSNKNLSSCIGKIFKCQEVRTVFCSCTYLRLCKSADYVKVGQRTDFRFIIRHFADSILKVDAATNSYRLGKNERTVAKKISRNGLCINKTGSARGHSNLILKTRSLQISVSTCLTSSSEMRLHRSVYFRRLQCQSHEP